MTSTLSGLNLRHLRGVAAIAEGGSLSAGAEAVSLSQPALTQGLAKLEARLGEPLFVRRPDGMAVTEAGRLIAARAGEAEVQLAQAMRSGRRGGFAGAERLLTMAQLRALLALADGGSFVGASAAVGVSQPALHRSVRDVERLAGTRLVERRGRGVALTDAGRRVVRGFRLAAAALEAGVGEVAALRAAGAGTLTVGAMPLARARLLPHAIAALHKAHPAARIAVIEGAHRALVDQLRDGQIDLMIGALREPAPGPDLVQHPLCGDALAIVARADHPLIGRDDVTIAELARFPWIAGLPDAPIRALWEGLFGDAGAPVPPVPIACGSVMTIRGLLLAGDYLTLLSPDQVWVELEAGLLGLVAVPVPATRRIGVTTRDGWRPTALQRAFLALLEAAAGADLPKSNRPAVLSIGDGTAPRLADPA